MPELRRLSPRSLRAQYTWLVVLLITLTFTALVAFGLRDRNADLERDRQDMLNATRASLSSVTTTLTGVEQLLVTLSSHPVVQDLDSPECDARLEALVQRFEAYYVFGVADPQGRFPCSSRPAPGDFDVRDHDWFQQAVSTREFSVGQFMVGPVSGRPTLVLGYPVVNPEGQLERVVAASLDLAVFQQIVQNLPLAQGGVLTIYDRAGTILARYPDSAGLVGKRFEGDLTAAVLKGKEGYADLPGLDGVERLYAFVPLRVAGQTVMYASTGISTNAAYGQANRDFAMYLALLGLFAFGLVLVVARTSERLLLRPILALRDVTERWSGGELSARVAVHGAPEELQTLAAGFNQMAGALETRLRDIQALNASLEQRVAERTAQLRVSNEALETFAYSVAHDLRTPLRTIHGFTSEVLHDHETQLSESGRADLRRVLANAERLDALIRDLLAYARLAQADIDLKSVPTTVVMEEVLAQLQFEVRRLEAHVNVQPDLPAVRANHAVLRQVLLNLVGNALKFAKPGQAPTVRVWAEQVGSNVRLCVQDDGIGIDPRDQQRIFQAFERLNARHDGTGIGLAVVSRGAQRMHGRAGVVSQFGEGSLFWVELPAADDGVSRAHESLQTVD